MRITQKRANRVGIIGSPGRVKTGFVETLGHCIRQKSYFFTVAFCSAVNQKNQQVENIIREKTVVAFYEQPTQAVLPNQLVGIVVQLFDTRLFISKQTLNIRSTDNGVTSKDDLKVTGGTLNITCSADALEANDSIAIAGGSITISTNKDGLHAENDEDNAVGYIYICGGSLDINAGSDGIQGTTIVQIDNGNINISASEGIEGTYVQINGGDITVNMGQGDTDGVDSNGNLFINGGTIRVNAQSPFDYDGTANKTGGTIIVNGTQTDTITNQMMGGMGGMQPGGMNRR